GTAGVRAEWAVRIDPAETWTAQWAQTHGRGRGVSQPGSSQRLLPTNRRLGPHGERRIQCGGAPAQRRTETLTAKKTTVNSLLSEVCASDELVARYEELRRQALDQSSRIHRGPGLAMLIQRGMRAWMDVSSRGPTTPSPIRLRPSNLVDAL